MTATGNRPWSLSQLHLLLTGECKYECDHCFVWSGPGQGNTMDREVIGHILDQEESYADACHLCYLSRSKLREMFPDVLTPDQMYGDT